MLPKRYDSMSYAFLELKNKSIFSIYNMSHIEITAKVYNFYLFWFMHTAKNDIETIRNQMKTFDKDEELKKRFLITMNCLFENQKDFFKRDKFLSNDPFFIYLFIKYLVLIISSNKDAQLEIDTSFTEDVNENVQHNLISEDHYINACNALQQNQKITETLQNIKFTDIQHLEIVDDILHIYTM